MLLKNLFNTFILALIGTYCSAQLSLQYKIREVSKATKNTPIIIFLHGYGSNEEDLFSLAQFVPAHYTVVSARAPITLSQGSYAWYNLGRSNGKINSKIEDHLNAIKILEIFIEQLKKKYLFDHKQIYLLGFSQGSIISYSLALSNPSLIKGIAVFGGRLEEKIKPKIKSNTPIKNLKVFITHGIQDQVINISESRSALVYLKQKGIKPDYHEYNAGHEINEEMLKAFVKWLK